MDVIEQGPHRDRPPPRRTRMLVVLALGLAGAGLVGRWALDTGSDEAPAREVVRSSPAPAPPTARAATTAPAEAAPAVTATGRPWPERAGACGNTAELPQVSVPDLSERTGLRVVVGGSGLHVVDVDSGRSTAVGTRAVGGGAYVTSLVGVGSSAYVLSEHCDELSTGGQRLVRLAPDLARVLPVVPRRADQVIVGSGGAWSVRYPDDADSPLVVRALPGGGSARLPGGFAPVASTRSGFVGTTSTGNAETDVPLVQVVSHGRVVRTLGRGNLLVADDSIVVLSEECPGAIEPRKQCALMVGPPDGSGLHRVLLPPGRAVVSGAVLSPDSTRLAFQLSRARSSTAYATGHPFPSSDLAVLDLRSGRLQVLAGVELAPKYAAGLAFSSDGRWLVVALNEGNEARLLVWREGWSRPRLANAAVRGPVLYDVPVLDAASLAR